MMGFLRDGQWIDEWYDTKSTGGKFERTVTQFRNWITADGSSGFKAESGRYHLYVSLACPWACRVLAMRTLKGLEEHISVSIVHPLMLENGWTFQDGEGVIEDAVNSADYLYQVYLAADPNYFGRVTVPVLWDKQTNTIVNNESSEIIRMFNTEFNALTGNTDDYYPEALRDQINEINEFVYHNINNGVYKAGFATAQNVYEEEVVKLFAALDKLEQLLSQQQFLVGDTITEADIRLFTTLIRFDAVYYGHFKCNIKQLVDYPNLWDYTKRIYHLPGIAETVNFNHIKQHYYGSHKTINPTGVVPYGPKLDLSVR